MLIERLVIKLKKDGVFGAIFGFLSMSSNKIKWRFLGKRLQGAVSSESRFELIYNNNMWGSKESVSGFGSTLKYTEKLRAKLPSVINSLDIGSILDAPCGDFNWMKEVVRSFPNVSYIGADIVRDLVKVNNNKYGKDNISFVHLDIVKDQLPDVDLMICRDCLFHLCEEDILKFFANFCRSNIKYLITTSHDNESGQFCNVDIENGEFRLIDLFSSPYNLSSDFLFKIEDWMEPEPKRFMYLWSRSSIELAFSKNQLSN